MDSRILGTDLDLGLRAKAAWVGLFMPKKNKQMHYGPPNKTSFKFMNLKESMKTVHQHDEEPQTRKTFICFNKTDLLMLVFVWSHF